MFCYSSTHLNLMAIMPQVCLYCRCAAAVVVAAAAVVVVAAAVVVAAPVVVAVVVVAWSWAQHLTCWLTLSQISSSAQ